MKIGASFFALLTSNLACFAVAIHEIVGIPGKGKIKGITQHSQPNSVTAFLGVPYGRAPVGNLRFEKPRMVQSYSGPEGVLDCTQLALSCYGTTDDPNFRGTAMWNPQTPFSEDCLNMNIWVPNSGRFNYPVMVWIYGGGFFSGSPSLDLYDGRILASYTDVIVININYRLGPLGFLYIAGSSVRGNMGLFDQQLALQWVQENIRSFGGDPNRVTLFGESAGASSATAHLIANTPTPRFVGVILESGTITNSWAYEQNPSKLDGRSKEFASYFGCSTTSPDLILPCLRNISAEKLQEKAFSPTVDGFLKFPFTPMSDALLFPGDSFFRPGATGNEGQLDFSFGDMHQVPILAGSNTNEGTYFLPYFLDPIFKLKDAIEQCTCTLTNGQYNESISTMFSDKSKSLQDLIACWYRKKYDPYKRACSDSTNRPLTELRDAVGHIVGDGFFSCELYEFAKTVSAFTDVYMYYFDHRSPANPWPEWMGVMHGYEIEYIFGYPFRWPALYNHTRNELDMEQNFSRGLMSYWSKFAQEQRPGNSWKPFTKFARHQAILRPDLGDHVPKSWELCEAFRRDKHCTSKQGCDYCG